ncbi:MAG: hypothetical protein EAZ95_17665 [Bacteroidetes bacterium]|nr:MAG: hypothetical protein EAZ95_17665 [Bacteroidota bacterium]
MAKKRQQDAVKNWREGELVMAFGLTPNRSSKTSLMEEWLGASLPILNDVEQSIFRKILDRATIHIAGWEEEDLKVKFIGHILELGLLEEGNGIVTCFDKTISATVQNVQLIVKSDFMVASGFMNVIKQPFFHFQEYKPLINPKGEPMAQLLEAFLIAQEKNEIQIPLYGVEVIGKHWSFVIMEGKDYCISPAYDSTVKEDLLQIIGILRKFREILETRLMKAGRVEG